MWEFLEKRHKAGFKTTPIEERPESKPELNFVWKVFNTLSRGRSFDFNNRPLAISVKDINAYCQLYEVSLTPTTIDWIFAIDDEFLELYRKPTEDESNSNEKQIEKRAK